VAHQSTTFIGFDGSAGNWNRARGFFALTAVLGLALTAVGFFTDRERFFASYMTAYLFFLTLVLGTLFFVLVQHLSRAGWSVAVRRLAETAGWTVPFFALLFLPLLGGLGDLFHWTHPDAVAHDALLRHKEDYLNVPFFLVRAALYFVVWSAIGITFHRASAAQDASRDPRVTASLQRRAAPAMILYALTVTFMAFDWIMSMDPHWYSTIFGVYVWSGGALSAFAFLAVTALVLQRTGRMDRVLRADHFQDLGRLLFAFSVFWAYIAFSQFFLIWYGNIPEETIFYLHRMQHGWYPVSLFLAAGHFAVPFALLMSRWTKRRPSLVIALAVWILLMHYLDLYWLVFPNFLDHGPNVHWLDAAAWVGIGGTFLFVFTTKLSRHALVPAGDPRLSESLALEHAY
jgi:hypothetical protein